MSTEVEVEERSLRHHGVPPMRTGKFLQLARMAYGMGYDPKSGALMFNSRVVLGVVSSMWTLAARERTTDGAVTAIDRALRTAITRMGHEIPQVQLWPYHITLTSRAKGTSSPVIAQAKVSLDGWKATRKVRHADGVTAAAFLLFDAYDHILWERWKERLEPAGVSPKAVLVTMLRQRERERRARE